MHKNLKTYFFFSFTYTWKNKRRKFFKKILLGCIGASPNSNCFKIRSFNYYKN